jgi:hypothetical protein
VKLKNLTYITQELDSILNLVDTPRVQKVLHGDRLRRVDTSRFDPELKSIQVQRLVLLVLTIDPIEQDGNRSVKSVRKRLS